MPNPPRKVPAGTRIPGQKHYRMTKSVYKDPASYMDKHAFGAETERLYQAQEAKRMRTTAPSSTKNMMPAANTKGALKKLPLRKLKAILALLTRMGGAPRGQSPIPYTRLGSGMDMD